jgi:hypothetical protein
LTKAGNDGTRKNSRNLLYFRGPEEFAEFICATNYRIRRLRLSRLLLGPETRRPSPRIISRTLHDESEFAFMKSAILALGIGASLLMGCGMGSLHDEKLVGPYHLAAINTLEDMQVCYALSNGDTVGRIEGTVYAVGWNDSFIVAKQHPHNNRSITRYYVLDISRDSTYANPATCISGPLTEAEFRSMQSVFGLPTFTRVIRSLE